MKILAGLMGPGALDLQTMRCSHRGGGESGDIGEKMVGPFSNKTLPSGGAGERGEGQRWKGPLMAELRELSSSSMW